MTFLPSKMLAEGLAPSIEQFGNRMDTTAAKTVAEASVQAEKNILLLSSELGDHRKEFEASGRRLIEYAHQCFDASVEKHVAAIKAQTSALIDEKVSAMRKSLSEAAEEQKRVFLRNASIAVGSAVIVAFISIVAKNVSNTPLDALSVFRIVLGMFAAGSAASLLYRLFLRYKTKSAMERDTIKVVLSDVAVLSPRGVRFHAVVLLVVTAFWLLLLMNPGVLGL